MSERDFNTLKNMPLAKLLLLPKSIKSKLVDEYPLLKNSDYI